MEEDDLHHDWEVGRSWVQRLACALEPSVEGGLEEGHVEAQGQVCEVRLEGAGSYLWEGQLIVIGEEVGLETGSHLGEPGWLGRQARQSLPEDLASAWCLAPMKAWVEQVTVAWAH